MNENTTITGKRRNGLAFRLRRILLSRMPPALTKHSGLVDTWGRRNRKHHDRPCRECGKQFHPREDTKKFCSRKCACIHLGKSRRVAESWWIDDAGYEHGKVWRNGRRVWVKRHRWIMEQHLERLLKPSEDVHHKDENKLNNDLSNLELLDHGKHSSLHNANRKRSAK